MSVTFSYVVKFFTGMMSDYCITRLVAAYPTENQANAHVKLATEQGQALLKKLGSQGEFHAQEATELDPQFEVLDGYFRYSVERVPQASSAEVTPLELARGVPHAEIESVNGSNPALQSALAMKLTKALV